MTREYIFFVQNQTWGTFNTENRMILFYSLRLRKKEFQGFNYSHNNPEILRLLYLSSNFRSLKSFLCPNTASRWSHNAKRFFINGTIFEFVPVRTVIRAWVNIFSKIRI